MDYKIQHRLHILSQNAFIRDGTLASFSELDIHFSHWAFNWADGWSHNYWLAEGTIEALNFIEAGAAFTKKLGRIVPRIALIGQCYSQAAAQPLLIHKIDSDVAYFRYVREIKGVPLMFREDQVEALGTLLKSPEIPEEFYRYWNDVVNTIGYSAKLVLMFAAIEALFKRERKKSKEDFYAKMETVFGPELKIIIYGTKKKSNTGLRHRLMHGEYLGDPDTETNYVELIHKRVIEYFNTHIFHREIISQAVVNPQRHLFGNLEGWWHFIKPKGTARMSLKDIFEDFAKHDSLRAENYDLVPYEENISLHSSY